MKKYTVYRNMIEKCDAVADTEQEAGNWCYAHGPWFFHECEPEERVDEETISPGQVLHELLQQQGVVGQSWESVREDWPKYEQIAKSLRED